MEANWNQLIERYLENELSEEGKLAFEAELASNSELREELDLHQTVRDGAVRSAQRIQLASIGASYHRSVRMKQAGIAAAIVIGAGLTTAIVLFNGKGDQSSPVQQKNQISTEVQHADASMLQPASDSLTVESEQDDIKRAMTYRMMVPQYSDPNSFLDLVDFEKDGVSLQADPEVIDPGLQVRGNGSVIDSEDEDAIGERLYDTVVKREFPMKGMMMVKKDGSYGIANSKGLLVVVPKYDSIGKFDDLIPCLALVMDEKKFGFIDRTGKEVIPLTYDQIVENAKFRRRYIPGLRGGLGLFHRKKPRIFYIFAGDNTTSYCKE